MFVEEIEKIRLLRFINGSQHVLGVQQNSQHAHELHRSSQFGICVADHLLYDYVKQHLVLKIIHIKFNIQPITHLSNNVSKRALHKALF
jgi:hypothetical protein